MVQKEMAHVQANIFQFHSKLVEFWAAGKYTDVTIECDDGTVFRCHRVALATACEYFDTMFSSKFRERTADNIHLREISAATFGLVLQFIYTGDVAISVDNVSSLLQASELFRLSGIEDLCVQFVEVNGLTVSDSWDLLAFARATNKKTLVDILSHRIATRFEIFSKGNRFLEVLFDDLSSTLKRMSTPLMTRKDISMLAAVARWVEHKGEESQCYLDELIELVGFENIPQKHLKTILSKLLANSTQSSEHCKGHKYVVELLQEGAVCSTERLLHFSVKDTPIKLYSMNSSHVCSVSATIPLNQPNQWISTIAVDDSYFYCLNYKYRFDPTENLSHSPTFYAHTSVNMDSRIKLKSPPGIFPYIRAIAQQNNIYIYNPVFVSQPAIRSNVSSSFSDGEIRRGIWTYNCEVDNWFPVPMMKIEVEMSSLATCEDGLYLIGGEVTSGSSRQGAIVQFYDRRVGNWEELPRTNYEHVLAASCLVDGRIYVFGGTPNIKSAERYDLAARRWENLAPMNNGTNHMTAPVPSHHLKQLWVKSGNMCFDVYNAELNEWKTVPIITEGNIDLPGQIMGSFVFRSL